MSHELEHRDDVGARLGMWIFIFSEMLLFAGLFIVYAVYRYMYPTEFHEASLELNAFMGTVNTIILLVSSMTIAMSITAIQYNDKKKSLLFIALTLFLAFVFLVNKYFEWGHKFEIGLYLGSNLIPKLDNGHSLFFGLYYFMTGLHAVHILVGMVLIGVCFYQVKKDQVTQESHTLLVNGALYWHLVDLIWIFLFPLLYLLS